MANNFYNFKHMSASEHLSFVDLMGGRPTNQLSNQQTFQPTHQHSLPGQVNYSKQSNKISYNYNNQTLKINRRSIHVCISNNSALCTTIQR